MTIPRQKLFLHDQMPIYVNFYIYNKKVKSESEVAQLCPTLWEPMDSPWATRILHPWDFPGKSTGVGCHFLLQGIFPTQELNPGLLYYRQMLYPLSHQGDLLNYLFLKNLSESYRNILNCFLEKVAILIKIYAYIFALRYYMFMFLDTKTYVISNSKRRKRLNINPCWNILYNSICVCVCKKIMPLKFCN